MIVDDPDAAFQRAVAAGATIVHPVGEDYGWRLGRIADPFGHHWEIGKPWRKAPENGHQADTRRPRAVALPAALD